MIMTMEERPRHGRPRWNLRLHDRRPGRHCSRRPIPNRMGAGPWDHRHRRAVHGLLRLAHELRRPDGHAHTEVRLLLRVWRACGHHLRHHGLLYGRMLWLRRLLRLLLLLLLLHIDHLYPRLRRLRLRLLRRHDAVAQHVSQRSFGLLLRPVLALRLRLRRRLRLLLHDVARHGRARADHLLIGRVLRLRLLLLLTLHLQPLQVLELLRRARNLCERGVRLAAPLRAHLRARRCRRQLLRIALCLR